MAAPPSIVLTLNVITTDPAEAARSAEVLARAATGIALDGISIDLTIGTVHDEDEG